VPEFPRGFSNRQAHIRNAVLLERLARETGGDMRAEATLPATPADAVTLRGIPAVGRGVSGVIAGTQPEQEVSR